MVKTTLSRIHIIMFSHCDCPPRTRFINQSVTLYEWHLYEFSTLSHNIPKQSTGVKDSEATTVVRFDAKGRSNQNTIERGEQIEASCEKISNVTMLVGWG